MSFHAERRAWALSVRPPAKKLVLIYLAFRCAQDGGRLFMSLATIARAVGISRCQAQRYVRSLIEDGIVVVTANAAGGSPTAVPHYRILIDRLPELSTDGADDTGSTGDTGSAEAEEGSHGCSGGVAPMPQTHSTHATQDINRHQLDITETPKKTRASKSRKSSMPDDFGISEAVRTWADEKGFADLDAHLEYFRSYAMANGKTYLDWDQAFMNAIRGNWAKVRLNKQESLEASNRAVGERWLAGSKYSAAAAGVFEPAWRAEQRARTQQAAPGVAVRNTAERRAATIAGLTDPGAIDVPTRVVSDTQGRRPASSGFDGFDYTEGLNNGTGS